MIELIKEINKSFEEAGKGLVKSIKPLVNHNECIFIKDGKCNEQNSDIYLDLPSQEYCDNKCKYYIGGEENEK